ncbi:histidine kinase sensor domain-containing protein [Aestuariirhabdus sp. Z084]|uniref:HAMP domain-containing sensor histidine kinase n=1 Tax=Aestuariirhabdus haliotis TaxID=2918751 RepID=UPI00201B36B3|nr:histidine kinase sensor domain-containing protein [Aestuariirhabdus haliotis]MCL6415085.1 histidine kinase sensor domain-containing protein [Aestuariirhabdus haliotis]MCL6419017.1 histidine kinase sensor domain-containing protein [Aestuariirhabdus haliotis]
MRRRLFWKMWLIIATGVVAMIYVIGLVTSNAEEDMSIIHIEDREQLRRWCSEAETLFLSGDLPALNRWLHQLERQENTWVSVARSDIHFFAGDPAKGEYSDDYSLGRNVDWKIHLYFVENPVMELPFSDGSASLLIRLPDRMRPGSYWNYVKLSLQVLLPMVLLALVAVVLYRHIMLPLRQLGKATRAFSRGNFDVRVQKLLGNRRDELTDLAITFDLMAARIGELIVNQRQLISDLSHELRTPLTRLDIAVEGLLQDGKRSANLERVRRESVHVRKLVEDTLTLAWMDNERPRLHDETLDLVDLLDVVIRDARFEFPDRIITAELPQEAVLERSSHRSLGQALENIIRNALRYSPVGESVYIALQNQGDDYSLRICDSGPGVPEQYLEAIFRPFFRIDPSRQAANSGFGLGLALARRQLAAVGGCVYARNRDAGGLLMQVTLPKT